MRNMVIVSALMAIAAQAPLAVWSKPDAVRGFGGWHSELQSITDRFGRTPVAHFCIVVRTMPLAGQRDRTALVYWKEDQTIQGYAESAENRMSADLTAGAEHIDLKRDLVDRRSQIGSSTVLETRAHAGEIIDNCRRHGTTVAIRKGSRRGAR